MATERIAVPSAPSVQAAPVAPHPTLVSALRSKLTEDEIDLLNLCRPVEATVEHTPGNSIFHSVHIGKAWYRDVSANCACTDLRLYEFSGCAYSTCAKHGMQLLGYIVLEYKVRR